MTPEARATVLALADDEMLMGHHHAHWICVAPFLEEDLAFCSIGQDELGHAATLYELLVDAADVDRFALRRPPAEYRSAWLCEADLPDWSDTTVRHWLYDTAEQVRWEALAAGDDAELAALATAALREEAYHRRHATGTLVRLLGGTAEARAAVLASLERLAPLAGGLFEGDTAGWSRFRAEADADLAAAGVSWTWPPEPPEGQGRSGVRSPAFAAVQARLNAVFDLDPEAAW
jgi:ring-1,2-phenylacetyl-CoA epoxidase subunit PaaC